MNNKFKKITAGIFSVFVLSLFMTTPVFAAQVDPAGEISLIVERVITIATQVGSGVLILFIVKDAFELMQNKDNPMVRNMLARDIFLLIVSAIFLFRPDFILNAIRFIANA